MKKLIKFPVFLINTMLIFAGCFFSVITLFALIRTGLNVYLTLFFFASYFVAMFCLRNLIRWSVMAGMQVGVEQGFAAAKKMVKK